MALRAAAADVRQRQQVICIWGKIRWKENPPPSLSSSSCPADVNVDGEPSSLLSMVDGRHCHPMSPPSRTTLSRPEGNSSVTPVGPQKSVTTPPPLTAPGGSALSTPPPSPHSSETHRSSWSSPEENLSSRALRGGGSSVMMATLPLLLLQASPLRWIVRPRKARPFTSPLVDGPGCLAPYPSFHGSERAW